MTDIVKRLREGADFASSAWAEDMFTDAADEIERLRAVLRALREAEYITYDIVQTILANERQEREP